MSESSQHGEPAGASGMTRPFPGLDAPSSTRALLLRLAAAWRPRFALPEPDQARAPGVDWVAWRTGLRAALWETLGVTPDERPVVAEIVGREACDGYVREKLYVDGAFGSRIPCYLLIPDNLRAPAPGLLCLHGHGGLAGNLHVVGLPAGPEMARADAAMHYDYAVRFARRGYVTIAPDAHSFGERAHWSADGIAAQNAWDRREHTTLGLAAAYLGLTLPGMRVVDDLRAHTYLAARPEVDAARIGCVGLSEGGKRTMFLAALDERIAVAVVSGYFTTLRRELTEPEWEHLHGWDVCNWLPGLLRVADFPDVLALCAPRPLLIQNGTRDPLYSWRGIREGYARLAAAYAAQGAAERVALDAFEGLHIFNPGPAEAWLAQWLGR
jgi:dienelactone hydrolase